MILTFLQNWFLNCNQCVSRVFTCEEHGGVGYAADRHKGHVGTVNPLLLPLHVHSARGPSEPVLVLLQALSTTDVELSDISRVNGAQTGRRIQK